jgi:hypothetical protein
MEPNANEEALAGGRRPTHIAYWVKDRENQKGVWQPIGVAWAHVDGKGLTLALDLQPRDGRITLRVLEERPSEQAKGGSMSAVAGQ